MIVFIALIVLFVWIIALHWVLNKQIKDLNRMSQWCAYLETSIKHAGILVFNPDKGKRGEFEVNQKLTELLK